MKTSLSSTRRPQHAFTIVELLVVITIIGILAGLLIPAILRSKVRAQVNQAKIEMANLASAIKTYYTTYNRYPVSSAVLTLATTGNTDYTYGYPQASPLNTPLNSDVMAILMDITTFPNGTPTVNANHVKNPQQIKASGVNMANSITDPGLGPDLCYRDPWGNAYVITMDLNADDKCLDVFYKLKSVSQPASGGPAGLNGLSNTTDPAGNGDHFEYNGGVMIWSLGPDKSAQTGPTGPRADQDPNKDNVLSWKQ